MDPAQVEALVAQADASLASQTPDTQLQAALAAWRPDLWTALASNPATYPDLLTWLGAQGNPAVDAALAARTTASSAPTATWTAASAPVAATPPTASWTPTATSAPAAATPYPDHPFTPGAVPLTSAPLTPLSAPPRSGPGRRKGVAAVAAVVLVLAACGVGYAFSRGSHSTTAAATAPAAGATSAEAAVSAAPLPTASAASGQITACDQNPDLTPTSISGDAVSLTVTVSVTAACTGGDVLGGSGNTVTVYGPSSTDGSGPADAVIALGSFDLSHDTVVVPPSGAQLELTFGSGQYFRLADDLSVPDLEITPQIDRTTGETTAKATDAHGTVSVTAGEPDAQTAEEAAGAALRWQADKDYATAVNHLNGHWAPQISSKKPGLVANATTYDNRSTLADFYNSRSKYSGALLLYSDDWSVFDSGGHWWVTVVDEPRSDGASANLWCDIKSIPLDDCFAKYLDPSGSSEGSIEMRK